MKPQNSSNILVVDDDRVTRDLLHEVLAGEGYRVVTSGSGEEALEIGEQECFDVIISDMKLGSDLNGLDVLRAYKSIQPESEVILITAFGSMETAIEAVKAGAFDYLSKPFKIEEVLLQVERALNNRNLIRENRNLRHQLGSQVQLSSLVGRSPSMLEVYKKIAMVSDSRSTVLIYGESGTGKELVAKAIHHNGPRASQNFFAVNCGALPETLLETELFGHVRGSFTGAVENKRGIFEEASGGTVFLDEVSGMSPALQVKLLRTLEEHEVRRVGSNQTIKVDVRIIAASNRRLADLVEEGKFREDLYYRLRVIEIELPPLRERAEDIPLLVEHFLKDLERVRGKTFNVSTEALSCLVNYPWPGNVRELENALEAAIALNRSGVIMPEDLPAKVRAESGNADRMEEMFVDLPSLQELEKRYLVHVLRVTRKNKAMASRILGIDRKTLYRIEARLKSHHAKAGK
ncbi:MAG TPA: sigma-54 dependent transcriptional regulator [Terriglobia bacterium]|nr:sigma-54 dependent transcriptional regulator [Terriglobia bacterium]